MTTAVLAIVGLSWSFCLAAPPGDAYPVAARVGDEAIGVAEVDRFVRLAAGDRPVEPEARRLLVAGALEELVARRLVLAYAARTATGATPAEVDAALAAFRTRLAAEGKTLDAWLASEEISEEGLRRQFAWEITWSQYRQKYITEERLQQFFAAHRRQFDGTRLRVSQILIRPTDPADPQAWSAAEQRASELRQAIVSERTAFADAARQHSQSPSAADGGRLGTIGRGGPMPEPFTAAAFALDAGEVSPPVRTAFGVHLIRCDAVEAGEQTWLDARAALETALEGEMRDRIVAVQRRSTPVTYSPEVAYFHPESGALVMPDACVPQDEADSDAPTRR